MLTARYDRLGLERGDTILDLVATGDQGDDVGSAARRFEGVTPEAAPEIEDLVAALESELVVARGEH